MSNTTAEEAILKEYGDFRSRIRQILFDAGVRSNPGWSNDDIVNGLKKVIRENPSSILLTAMKEIQKSKHLNMVYIDEKQWATALAGLCLFNLNKANQAIIHYEKALNEAGECKAVERCADCSCSKRFM